MANDHDFYVKGESLATSKIGGDKPFEPYALQDISHYSINIFLSILTVTIRNGDKLNFQFASRGTLMQFKNVLDTVVN